MNDSLREYFRNYPIYSPAYSVVRIAGHSIREKASRYFSGRLIDIGCGTKAKTLLVGEYVEEYLGLDHPTTLHTRANIDFCGTAYHLPVKSETFDCALSTAVLEHLEEPQEALCETYRALKPGGYALYTAPLFWHIHEAPRDFFRYTEFGLKHLFESANFEIVEIEPLSGFWVTLGSAWNYYIQRFGIGPFKYAIRGCVMINNWLLPRLDRHFLRDEKFTWMYLVVAKKRG